MEKVTKKIPISVWLLLFFAALFLPLASGYGHNWDGIFHLFREQFPNILTRTYSAWNNVNGGSPLGYASGWLFLPVLSLLHLTFLPTEWQLYLILVLIFTALTLGLYNLFNKIVKSPIALILALVSVINPAIFYKLLAGHLFYLVGFTLFVWALNALINIKERVTWRDSVRVSILFALAGIQIQFLVFDLIVIVIYVLSFRTKNGWRLLIVYFIVTSLIHAYWLLPLLTQYNEIVRLSNSAQADSFITLVQASVKRVVTWQFSGATFIHYFFPRWVQLLAGCVVAVSMIGAALAIRQKPEEKFTWFSLTLFVLFLTLSTGVLHGFELPIISTFMPMLREAGHSAPLFVLATLLLLAGCWTYLRKVEYLRGAVLLTFSVLIIFGAARYIRDLPRINFNQARSELTPINNELSALPTDSYSILVYPFFNQYRYINQPVTFKEATPMSNSGWDSNLIFSEHNYYSNSVSPHDFADSIQYKLLRDMDVGVLREAGIKYLADYSPVYESNYNNFVSAEIYFDDIGLIKNRPHFLQDLHAKNPETVLLSEHVLEIPDVLPIISGGKLSFSKLNNSRYEVYIEPNDSEVVLRLGTKNHAGWRAYVSSRTLTCSEMVRLNEQVTQCKRGQRFALGDEALIVRAEQLVKLEGDPAVNEWRIDSDLVRSGVTVTLYYQPQGLYLLGALIGLGATTICIFCLVCLRTTGVRCSRSRVRL